MYIISYFTQQQHALLDQNSPLAQLKEKPDVAALPGHLVPSGMPVPIPEV